MKNLQKGRAQFTSIQLRSLNSAKHNPKRYKALYAYYLALNNDKRIRRVLDLNGNVIFPGWESVDGGKTKF